jgi:hypothetical protein
MNELDKKMAREIQQFERGIYNVADIVTLPLNHELCQWIQSQRSRKMFLDWNL